MEKQVQTWTEIANKAKNTKQIPILLYKDNTPLKRLLVDLVDKEIRGIYVNSKKTYEEVKRITDDIKQVPIFIENKKLDYDLEKQVDELNKRKIWLKSGGFIVIDKTEALTAIDVNSGKFTGKQGLEQTVFAVNKEATIEIAKQLRLRDIGGIVIIDYIDMKEDIDKEKIEKLLKQELKKDRSKTQVLGFTKLNLLEMTRKHIN